MFRSFKPAAICRREVAPARLTSPEDVESKECPPVNWFQGGKYAVFLVRGRK